MRVAAISAIAGAIIGALASLMFDALIMQPRQLRHQATNDFLVLFNSSYIGNHRSLINKFLNTASLRPLSEETNNRRDFNQKMLLEVEKDKEVIVSVLAIAGFYRQLHFCIKKEICSDTYVREIFRADAKEFSNWFSFVLRNFEKNRGSDSLDQFVSDIAGHSN